MQVETSNNQRRQRIEPGELTGVDLGIGKFCDAAPQKTIEIGGSNSNPELEDIESSPRKVALQEGQMGFIDLHLPTQFQAVSNPNWGVQVSLLGGHMESEAALAEALLWTITVEPAACLRQIDPETGEISEQAPTRDEVFNWLADQESTPNVPEEISLKWVPAQDEENGGVEVDLLLFRIVDCYADSKRPADSREYAVIDLQGNPVCKEPGSDGKCMIEKRLPCQG